VYYILNSNLINYVSNSTVEDASYAKTNHQHRRLSTIHLAFGLSGNHPGFLSEFEVALKSVLLHAPLDRDMHVHIVADRDAYQSLGVILNRTGLSTWKTRNSIEVHAYDITPELPQLKRLINDTFAPMFDDPKFDVLQHSTSVHTIGCFFRLFANRVIPTTVKHLAYMDTDVVIMANLEELWRQVEATPDALFHWGEECVRDLWS
jgi:lipopolysaccharide biosynthesis glycosyltransferase